MLRTKPNGAHAGRVSVTSKKKRREQSRRFFALPVTAGRAMLKSVCPGNRNNTIVELTGIYLRPNGKQTHLG